MIPLLAATLLAQLELPLDLGKLRVLAAEARQGKASNPRALLMDAHQRAQQQGDVLSASYAQAGLALLYEATNRAPLAESTWREALTPEVRRLEPAFAGQTAWWIAQEAAGVSRLPRARHWCEIAIREARAAEDHRTLALALQVAATQVTGKQRHEFLAESIASARRGATEREIALIQIDWGEALRVAGDLAGAIAELQGSSTTLRRLHLLPDAGRALNALARALAAHGRFRDALVQLQAAEPLLLHEPAHLARTRLEMVHIHAALGDLPRARRALDQVEKNLSREDRGLVTLLAHAFLHVKDYERAVAVAQPLVQTGARRRPTVAHWILSAALFHLGRYEESIAVATAALSATDQPEALINISSYRWRARSLDRMGRHAEAARDIREVVRLGEAVLLKTAPEDEMRLSFTDRLEEIADDAVEVLWRAGEQREALEAAERFRARAFLDLVAARDGTRNAEWFVPVERAVEYARSHRAAVLSTWAHPDRLYLWLITPTGDIRAQQVAVSEERLKTLVAQARRLRYEPDRGAWRELHRLLIQPVGAQLPRGATLTVLPHGPLLQLPFAALLAPNGRYLIEDHPVRTMPALALLVRPHALAATGPSLLAGAPVRSGLAALPGAQRELSSIRSLLGGEKHTYMGSQLTAGAIARVAPEARLLHFATHAVIQEADALHSYLSLSNGGRLTVEAVYGWRLHADLVMLSACRGASGRVAADGLLGFPRAFLYAGAASVIAPLVDIPDETTVRLVEEFYRQYARGRSKVEALRAAQLRLLGDLRRGVVEAATPAGSMTLPEHPGLWAPFVLMGED